MSKEKADQQMTLEESRELNANELESVVGGLAAVASPTVPVPNDGRRIRMGPIPDDGRGTYQPVPEDGKL